MYVSLAVREIETGKLAELLSGGGVIGMSGFQQVSKRADVSSADVNNPDILLGVTADATKAGSVVRSMRNVGLVLGIGARSQVSASIVEAVAIDVIGLEMGRRSGNQPMHCHRFTIDRGVRVVGPDSASRVPVPPRHNRHIGKVNDGRLSLCQANQCRSISVVDGISQCLMTRPAPFGAWRLWAIALRATTRILGMHTADLLYRSVGAVPGVLPTLPGFCVS